jgi:hypothetical protein
MEWSVSDANKGEHVHVAYLTARGWIAVVFLAVAILWGGPFLWRTVERVPSMAEYRIPMALSEDYWTLRQWLSVARGEESSTLYHTRPVNKAERRARGGVGPVHG